MRQSELTILQEEAEIDEVSDKKIVFAKKSPQDMLTLNKSEDVVT